MRRSLRTRTASGVRRVPDRAAAARSSRGWRGRALRARLRRHAYRSPDRRGGLPRAERRAARRGTALRAARQRGRGDPRGLAWPRQRGDAPAGSRGRAWHPAAGRHRAADEPHQPLLERGDAALAARHLGSTRARCADRRGGRGHARRGGASAPRPRLACRRGAEDDRQRPARDRLYLRLRHGRLDRDRGDRSPAHHGGEPQPGHRGRGDGPAQWLDRHLGRAGWGCGRDRDPRAQAHGRGDLSLRAPARRHRTQLQHRRGCRGGADRGLSNLDLFAEGRVWASAARRHRPGVGHACTPTTSATPSGCCCRWPSC